MAKQAGCYKGGVGVVYGSCYLSIALFKKVVVAYNALMTNVLYRMETVEHSSYDT